MGTRSKPAPETWGLYFAGHLIFEAVLTELDKLGMAQAEDILLSGASAGGIGAFSGRWCMTVWKRGLGSGVATDATRDPILLRALVWL